MNCIAEVVTLVECSSGDDPAKPPHLCAMRSNENVVLRPPLTALGPAEMKPFDSMSKKQVLGFELLVRVYLTSYDPHFSWKSPDPDQYPSSWCMGRSHGRGGKQRLPLRWPWAGFMSAHSLSLNIHVKSLTYFQCLRGVCCRSLVPFQAVCSNEC